MPSARSIFESSLQQALREERKRADDLKKSTGNIPVVHLSCDCGKVIKEKLLFNLLTASPLLFENFMFHFYKTQPAESQQEIAAIRATAKVKDVHAAVILLENLSIMNPVVTVKDVIEGLEYARMYRIIGQLQTRAIRVLSEHALCHGREGCCKSSRGIPMVPKTQQQCQPSHSQREMENQRPTKASRGIILLTFMEDGRTHAMNVKEALERPYGKSGRSYIVYTLSDFTQQISEDNMKNILWILSLVDFVVPILTNGYMKMLEDGFSNFTSFDEKYAPSVAKILLANWGTTFKNRQLRCFRPKDATWTSNAKIQYPPFLVAVNEITALPLILKKTRR